MYQSNHSLLHYFNNHIFIMLEVDAGDSKTNVRKGEYGEHKRQINAITAKQDIQLSIQAIQQTGVSFS